MVYMFMFVLYVVIVHLQCYRGWYVETGYVNTILEKLHNMKYAILTRQKYLSEAHKLCQLVSKNRNLVWEKLGKQHIS